MNKDYNNCHIGHYAVLTATSENGIIMGMIREYVIGEINEKNHDWNWKVQFSFDNKSLVKRLDANDITIYKKSNDKTFFERLIRDISSDDLETRQWTSEMLCDYIEDLDPDFDFEFLRELVEIMINRLSIEEDFDVQRELCEGIYEYICLQKLDKDRELQLVKKLALLNKEDLYDLLNNEEYLKLEEVKIFIEDKNKWWNTCN